MTGSATLEMYFTRTPMTLTVDAFSDASGANPGGTFAASGGWVTGSFSGEIICLSVNLHAAGATGRVTRSDNPLAPVGSTFLLYINDRERVNGPPRRQPQSPDLDQVFLYPGAGLQKACPPFDNNNEMSKIIEGGFTVAEVEG